MPQQLGDLRIAAIASSLRACQFFSGFPREELEVIAAFTVPKRLEKGEHLFYEGESPAGFYAVQNGAVSVYRVNATGREQVICVFRAGQTFAEAAIAGREGYPANARAIEPSTVLLIPKIDILNLLRKQPELAMRILGSMSQHLRVIVSLLDDLTLKNVEARLANWLLKRCPLPRSTAPVSITLDRTKRVLAAELGTASETLSRTLAKFRDDNLLNITGKIIRITDPLRLEVLLKKYLGEK
jgi:CRP/FNR family transcriptional regulator